MTIDSNSSIQKNEKKIRGVDKIIEKQVATGETFKVTDNKLKLDPSLIPQLRSGTYSGYHHVTWYVSNAKQAAYYFMSIFGFKPYAYRGLETGSRAVVCYVVKNGDAIFEFASPLKSDFTETDNGTTISPEGNGNSNANAKGNSLSSMSKVSMHTQKEMNNLVMEMNNFIHKHGDGVKDVAFAVQNAEEVYRISIKGGAKSIMRPTLYKDYDLRSYVKMAKVSVFGDTVHTLVEKGDNYSRFLPEYEMVNNINLNDKESFKIRFPIVAIENFLKLPPVHFLKIDHCVQNQGWNEMIPSCESYAKTFGFHQFWSVDEKEVSTEFSALRSIVMSSPDDQIKMPINEPAKGRCKSQIEEFLDYYEGPGVQHIAILTDNIIETVSAMRQRGAEFIDVPEKYYTNLLPRIMASPVEIKEDLGIVKKLGILVDFDDKGYLLQLFTKPLGVRPTIFIEVIQRRNHNGFGAGNFKALFETLEGLQNERGNLH
ncbi:hypothetical protein PACTADRAFT_78656 [Pachysolen tannophilus NRRL Y-2460]|uniref:4-hydroxyphenylpyruvate dioxygenase n=1 Tax=Pachysolen tannophilus NRRL Y-2460 TaxID=669874 RepID=A0A1E4U2N5_PACTA|nr:hypothetical protein PACTADRAFT_78656 [Pachysolen tannophilus NRRL Y-2460]